MVSALPAAAASTDWSPKQYKLTAGSAVADGDSWALTPNSAGKISLTLPLVHQELDRQHLLTLVMEGPSPQQFTIKWVTENTPGQLRQIQLAPPIQGSVSYDLAEVPGWEGVAKAIELEFRFLPGQKVRVWKVTLASQTLDQALKKYWNNWAGEQFWSAPDINFIKGTTSGQGPFPVPFFAGATGLVLLALGLLHVMRRTKGLLTWRVAGAAVVCMWIFSDVFWQLRLWRQVSQTWDTFGGKTSAEKLQASIDVPVVQLTEEAKQRIDDAAARVFVTSANDYAGMLSAYYMSPLNTYWNRGGPELPPVKNLHGGDYILWIPPSTVNYDSQAGVIRLSGGAEVRVHSEYNNAIGALFRVM